jgi:glycosyltransferase involved in cell wall biosynthesis
MILKYVYNGVDTSIVLLPAMREQFRNFPKMKIKVVANCYSSELDDLPLEKHKEDKAVKLLYLSNIMESKGIILLLEACDTLFSLYPDLSLKIAGTFIADEVATQNDIKQKFENHYNTLKQKYPNQIDYVGVVSGRDKNELLWESDIFILPTYYPTEAFPLSIIESMRAGNYIISTFHNLIPKIVTPDNGTLVEPRSTEAIVAAVKNCCSEKSGLEKIQNDNIEFAVANYNERKYVEQVVECCC